MGLFTREKKATPPRPIVVGELPPWAKRRETPAGLVGRSVPVIDVDADGMYTAWLAELSAYYKGKSVGELPGEWCDRETGMLKPEWQQCLNELTTDPERVTAYWLETVHQCGKMELQVCMRTFAFEIRIHDFLKTYAQKEHAPGRGARRASGGTQGGREARQHFKRLRGFIPS